MGRVALASDVHVCVLGFGIAKGVGCQSVSCVRGKGEALASDGQVSWELAFAKRVGCQAGGVHQGPRAA